MRSIIAAYLFVAAIALAWALQTPIWAYRNVRVFSSAETNSAEAASAQEALIRLGPNATPYLERGLTDGNANTQLLCAKVLMMMGEDRGESFLLKQLREHPEPQDGRGRKIEMLLLSVWDQRDGPSDEFRWKLNEVEHSDGHLAETLQAFKECLAQYPNWADGYARRAHFYQQSGETHEAKRDALTALSLAPNHFEALVTLGKIQLAVGAPDHAYRCFQRALMVNPRLKESLKDDIRETLKALDAEKAKYREDRRRNTSVA